MLFAQGLQARQVERGAVVQPFRAGRSWRSPSASISSRQVSAVSLRLQGPRL